MTSNMLSSTNQELDVGYESSTLTLKSYEPSPDVAGGRNSISHCPPTYIACPVKFVSSHGEVSLTLYSK